MPTLTTAPTPNRPYQPELDGVRGLAIAGVVAFHGTLIHAVTLFDSVYARVLRFGWTGVDLFFVLSGFLITRILYENRAEANYYRHFFTRRALRILPLYYLLLTCYVAGPHTIPHWPFGPFPLDYAAWFYTFTANFFMGWTNDMGSPWIAIMWSLGVEEQFYLTWPWIIRRYPAATLQRALIALLIAAPIWRGLWLLGGANQIFVHSNVLTRFDALAGGALVFFLLRQPALTENLRRWSRVALVVSAALVALIFGLDRYMQPPSQTIGYSLITLCYASFLILAQTEAPDGWLRRCLRNPGLRKLGRYSFALYLICAPVQWLLEAVLTPMLPEPAPLLFGCAAPFSALRMLLVCGPAVLLAALSYHLYEKHFLALGRPHRAPVTPEGQPAQDSPAWSYLRRASSPRRDL